MFVSLPQGRCEDNYELANDVNWAVRFIYLRIYLPRYFPGLELWCYFGD